MSRSHMFVSFTTIALSFLLAACNGDAEEATAVSITNEQTALAVVAKRIEGFNSHDADAYLSAHHEDVEIYEFPDKAIGNGRSHLEKIFGPLLEQGIGEVRVEFQIAIGNTVVSEEYLSYGGTSAQHIVAIYTVEDGTIVSFRLIESAD